MEPNPNPSPTQAAALKIAAVYAVVGSLWILCSGWVLHHFVRDASWLAVLEDVKGCFYVIVTAVLLGWWLDRYFRQIRRAGEQRRQAELRLQREEVALRGILNATTESVWMLNPDGLILIANETAARRCGKPLGEVIGHNFRELMPSALAESRATRFQEVVQSNRPLEFEDERGDVLFHHSLYPIADASGRVNSLVCYSRDVTERKRLQREHAAMEAQMRQQQKLESIGTLASGVAHEINNPINGIMNYAQLIRDKAEPGSPNVRYASEIVHETERVAAIVRNLLQFSRTDKRSHSATRPGDILEQTLSLIRTVLRHDEIELLVEVLPDLPQLYCRSQQIQQVLMNLVTNARDALNEKYPGPHEDKILRIICTTFAEEDRKWLRFSVEDHGPGITPEIQGRVFDPFFTTKPRDKGTGLGLSISHGIIRDHEGELWFETEPGRWTRFHVDLPLDAEP